MPVSYNTAGVRSNAPISPPEVINQHTHTHHLPPNLKKNDSFAASEFREHPTLGPQRQGTYYASQIERSPGMMPVSDQIPIPFSSGEQNNSFLQQQTNKRYSSNQYEQNNHQLYLMNGGQNVRNRQNPNFTNHPSGSVDDFIARQKKFELRKRKNLKKLTKEVRRDEIGVPKTSAQTSSLYQGGFQTTRNASRKSLLKLQNLNERTTTRGGSSTQFAQTSSQQSSSRVNKRKIGQKQQSSHHIKKVSHLSYTAAGH